MATAKSRNHYRGYNNPRKNVFAHVMFEAYVVRYDCDPIMYLNISYDGLVRRVTDMSEASHWVCQEEALDAAEYYGLFENYDNDLDHVGTYRLAEQYYIAEQPIALDDFPYRIR